jgi:hypothetical protein
MKLLVASSCRDDTTTTTYHHPAINFRDDPPHREFASVVVYSDIVVPIRCEEINFNER